MEQPIAFSHRTHAGDHDIPCLYCHRYAERSPVAGVPAVNICMGCHEIIGADSPEVQELTGFWERQAPIEWIKIHDLPDFVRFTHKRHARAGVGCEECHGPVPTMERIQAVGELTMGWCLECHRDRDAEDDCLICHH
ncbi:MAG: cytochrome c3 family protein [Acidobacteriota bacterium]